MGRSTADLDPGSSVTSVVGNREIAPGIMETVQITVEQLAALLSPAAVRAVFATKAEMDGSLGYAANAGAEVHADPNDANNGVYRKVGGSGAGYWVWISSLTAARVIAKIAEGDSAVQQALTALIDQERLDRVEAIAGEQAARQDAFAAEADTRDRAISAVAASNRAFSLAALAAKGRIGEAVGLATAETGGAPGVVQPLSATALKLGARGMVVEVSAGVVATVAVYPLEPGRQYRARFVVERIQDTAAPTIDAIRLAVCWLKADKSLLEVGILDDLKDITVASGRVEHSYIIGMSDADNIDVLAPPGAMYARLYVRTYGAGLTHVEAAEWTDLTATLDWSPDVSEFRNEVTAANVEIGVLQEAVAGLKADVASWRVREQQAAYEEISTDADFLLSIGASARVVRHTGTLTQNRKAVISVVDAEQGHSFRLLRTGAGAFALNVRTGTVTLKAMAQGSWADFTFDGATWFVSASGTL